MAYLYDRKKPVPAAADLRWARKASTAKQVFHGLQFPVVAGGGNGRGPVPVVMWNR